MGAVLHRVDDPRDDLMKMTRDELYAYGRANNVTFPQGANTPAFDMTGKSQSMVDVLRALGLRGPNMAHRMLGMPASMDPEPPVYVNKIRPEAPPMAEPLPPLPAGDVERMGMNELRGECKRRGIKMERRDNTERLREKLRAA